MRELHIKPQDLKAKTRKVGPQQAARLTRLAALKEELTTLEMQAGTPKMVDVPVLDDRTKKPLVDKKGKTVTKSVPERDETGDIVFEGSELSVNEMTLYRCLSTVVAMMEAEWNYGN